MKVLVFGANGLLGSSLIPYLQKYGYEVITSARNNEADVSVDLTDFTQMSDVLDKINPDVIINLVALTNVDECEQSPQLAYRVNTQTIENIVKWIKGNNGNNYLIHISTDQIYDGLGPHKENNIVICNYYGFSKYAAELAATKISSTVLRTNFFGPSMSPGRLSFSDWLIQSIKNKESITVFSDVFFSPLSLRSLVEMIGIVIEQRKQGIFNLGSKNGMSKADFAFALADTLGLPNKTMVRGTSDKMKLKAYRPKDMTMESTRFEKEFGVELPSLLQEVLLMRKEYDYKIN